MTFIAEMVSDSISEHLFFKGAMPKDLIALASHNNTQCDIFTPQIKGIHQYK